jgi:hypothetical protein
MFYLLDLTIRLQNEGKFFLASITEKLLAVAIFIEERRK